MALSLQDLESELDRAVDELRQSGRAGLAADPSGQAELNGLDLRGARALRKPSARHELAASWASGKREDSLKGSESGPRLEEEKGHSSRQHLLETFMREKKKQEAYLRDRLRVDDATESAFMNELLTAELKGMQQEIEDYEHVRAERKRLARSLHLGREEPRDRAVMKKTQFANSMKDPSDYSSERTLKKSVRNPSSLPRSDELHQTVQSMRQYFEKETEELEHVVHSYLDRQGMDSIRQKGEQLARTRKQDMIQLKTDLERRNEFYLDCLRNDLERTAQQARQDLKQEFDVRLAHEEQQLRQKYSPAVQNRALENYRAELDNAIRDKVQKLEERLYKEQRRELEQLSQQKLTEKQEELSRALEAASVDLERGQAALLEQLEEEFKQELQQAKENLYTSKQESTDELMESLHENFHHAKESELGLLHDALRQEQDTELKAVEEAETLALENAKAELRSELEASFQEELLRRHESALKVREEELAKVREEVRKEGEAKISSLQQSIRHDLEVAKADARRKAVADLDIELDKLYEQLSHQTALELEKEEADFLLDVGQAKEVLNRAALQCTGEDDSGHSDGERGEILRPPSHISFDRSCRAQVSRFLETLCEKHNKLVHRCSQLQQELIKVSRELLAARTLCDVRGSQLTVLQTELANARS